MHEMCGVLPGPTSRRSTTEGGQQFRRQVSRAPNTSLTGLHPNNGSSNHSDRSCFVSINMVYEVEIYSPRRVRNLGYVNRRHQVYKMNSLSYEIWEAIWTQPYWRSIIATLQDSIRCSFYSSSYTNTTVGELWYSAKMLFPFYQACRLLLIRISRRQLTL
jgi:hypothetical protein